MAAKETKKQTTTTTQVSKSEVKRPGVHSKKKTSNLKTSKNYKKPYKKQGRPR